MEEDCQHCPHYAALVARHRELLTRHEFAEARLRRAHELLEQLDGQTGLAMKNQTIARDAIRAFLDFSPDGVRVAS